VRRLFPPATGLAAGLAAAIAATVILLVPRPARADQTKLYLKSGSYVVVKSYQIQGDKIRFYNLDTSEWEEMPVNLVDFDATKRAREDEAAADAKEIEAAKKLEAEHFDLPASTGGFSVAPGRYLPTTEGVYAYDGLRLIPLIQSQGEIVTDKERLALNIVIPLPLLKKRMLVSLPGPEAAVRIVNPQPVFYVEAADGWGEKAEILPVKSAHGSRIVEKLQSGVGAGASGEIRDAVPLERSEVAKGIYKLQPSKPLEPGEYAVGEMIDGKLNLDVWDFGIDKAGKKTAHAAPESTEPAPMSEERPGEQRKQVGPRDEMPTNTASPTLPSGPPLPDNGVGPPIAPGSAPVQPSPPGSGPPPD
jgi:hypothetical protein